MQKIHQQTAPPQRCFLGILVAVLMLFQPSIAHAASKVRAFGETLGEGERTSFEKWYFAQIAHGATANAYWSKVVRKRSHRRKLRRKKRSFSKNDYVTTYPPKYNGPSLKRSLLKRWRIFRDKDKPLRTKRTSTLPGIPDFLASAQRHYNFVPDRIPEAKFKRRYAWEALSLGLAKEQVVRIYALETGGNGTADMQAGIHPISKKGRPISSAIGYAQLLAANTINVISKHGAKFLARLREKARRTNDANRRQKLLAKARSLRAMIRTARSVPYRWSRHVALARTSRGRGLHPLNIDGDIGPWLQVLKLAELKSMARRKGRHTLSGAQIELMNLAGPGTGLEMMLSVARDKPTTNFFSRRAYYRNSIVRGRSADGLLVALEGRMKVNIQQKGAQEFARIFDELLRERSRRASNQ